MGNFNQMRYPCERTGQGVFDQDSTNLFNNAIEALKELELNPMGGFYTWSDCGRLNNVIYSKIDHKFANKTWLHKWTLATIESFIWGTIDHVA